MAEIAAVDQVEEQEPEPRSSVPQWERAECTCPDWCERDHELD